MGYSLSDNIRFRKVLGSDCRCGRLSVVAVSGSSWICAYSDTPASRSATGANWCRLFFYDFLADSLSALRFSDLCVGRRTYSCWVVARNVVWDLGQENRCCGGSDLPSSQPFAFSLWYILRKN